ncbi:MAG: hypothetical protein ACRDV4_11195, partial [Acidimicrobiales bacterium]
MGWQLSGGESGGTESRPATVSGGSEQTVLVVAQDFATRQSLISVLASADIEAFGAGATEALAIETLYRPSVTLVEHRLSGPDGLALAKRMKERQPGMPVLLLTDPSCLDSSGPSPHVDAYLVKPLVRAEFLQTVLGELEQARIATGGTPARPSEATQVVVPGAAASADAVPPRPEMPGMIAPPQSREDVP